MTSFHYDGQDLLADVFEGTEDAPRPVRLVHDALVLAIRQHMDEHRISQRDIAAALNCRDTYVANILSRRSSQAGGRATLRSVQKVLDVLGVDVDVRLIERFGR